jgi:hypothetical protein
MSRLSAPDMHPDGRFAAATWVLMPVKAFGQLAKTLIYQNGFQTIEFF